MLSILKSQHLCAFVLSLFVFFSIHLNAQCLDGVAVSGGEDHTMVIMGDGSVWTCGDNQFVQLGNSGAGEYSSILLQVQEGEMNTISGFLGDVNDISAGWKHSIALDEYGYVWTWGNNGAGQLGINSTIQEKQTPVQVHSGEQSDPNDPHDYLENIIDIAAGRSGTHSLAVDADGYCYAWGNNGNGQLGNNDQGNNSLVPCFVHGSNDVGLLQNIIAVSAGAYHSMALGSDGHVYTFGSDDYGQIGNGSQSGASPYPVLVLKGQQSASGDYLENIVDISAGWDHCVALEDLDDNDSTLNGRVYAWGENTTGQLGNGNTTDCQEPVLVVCGQMQTASGYLENIVAVSAGDPYSVALDKNGNVWAWGENTDGQLGNNSDTDSTTPVKVRTGEQYSPTGYLEDIVAISAGYWHCLAVDKYGIIYSWGKGDDGRLGLGGSTADRWTPQQIPCVADVGLEMNISSDFTAPDCIDPFSTDPNEYTVTFTISYGNPVTDANDPNYVGTISDVALYSFLPDEINPMAVTVTGGGSYSMFDNTVTWDIGTLDPGDTDSVTVTVEVKDIVEPGGSIANLAILTSDIGWVKKTEQVDICCYDNDIIYVDAYATGIGSGVDWENAYTDLQQALARAESCGANEIWVAKGTYIPGNSYSNHFSLLSDVELYGGFSGNETSVSQRDFVSNKTYLSGDNVTQYVVEAKNCNEITVIDGFIITSSNQSGIGCDNVDVHIKNCVIADNGQKGIDADDDSDITVTYSIIKDNGSDGIYVDDGDSSVVITNSKIHDNSACGINLVRASGTIKNNWIHQNGTHGISVNNISSAVTIRNNTICYNGDKAVIRSSGTAPMISNCILWYNDEDGGLAQTAESYTYSCYTNPSDPDGSDANAHVPNGSGNIYCVPGFAYSDPNLNNFHLVADSDCIDKGDTYPSYPDEEDIDTEDRVYNSRVDMGADEVHCNDVYNALDYNGDGYVNYVEYASFAKTWLQQDPDQCGGCDPNQTDDWDPRFDFNSDYIVDVNDLTMLLDEWLWEACWLSSSEGTFMAMMSMGAGVGEESLMASAETQSISEFRIDRLSARREFEVQQAALELTLQEQIIQLEDLLQSLYEMQESQQFSARYSYQSALNESIAHLEKWLAGLYDEYEAKYQE